MSSFLRRGARMAGWIGLGVASALAAPAACLFPDYSFNEPEPSGGTSSGGGGATTTTTSSGGGPPTTSTSTSGGTEDCANGVDDDGNNLVDCQDPGCTASVCVPEVPADWTGYFALFEGPQGQDPGCPAEFPSTTTPAFVGNNGLTAPPATCSCACGAAQGQTCGPLSSVTLQTSDAPCGQGQTCVGEFAPPPAGWTGTCINGGGFQGGQTTCGPGSMCTNGSAPCTVSISATAVEATGGMCPPSLTEDVPEVTWATFGRACGDAPLTGKGCNVGQTCLPRPEAPYESGVCISKPGNNACPPGAFAEKHVFFKGVTDTRGCADNCSCTTPAGGTCPTMVTVYGTLVLNSCTSPVVTFPAGSCVNLAGNPTVGGQTATPLGQPAGATCTPSVGAATGSAAEADPTTFCCIP